MIRDMPDDRIIVETDCPYLAPIPHARPAQRAGLPAARARQAGRDPRLVARRRPRRAPRTPSSPCSTGFPGHERRAGVHHPGLRLLRRRAARGRRLGRLRSGRSAQPPHALLAAGAPHVGADGGAEHDDHGRRRHLAGVPPADGRGRASSGWTRCCSPTTTPTRPTASTTSAPSPCASGAGSPATWTTATHGQTLMRRFGYIFRRRGRAIRRSATTMSDPAARRRPGQIDGPSGAIPSSPSTRITATSARSATGSATWPIPATWSTCRPRRFEALARREALDRRRAALHAASDPRSRRRRRSAWIDAREARARDPDQSAHRSRLRDPGRAAADDVEPAYDGLRVAVPL